MAWHWFIPQSFRHGGKRSRQRHTGSLKPVTTLGKHAIWGLVDTLTQAVANWNYLFEDLSKQSAIALLIPGLT